MSNHVNQNSTRVEIFHHSFPRRDIFSSFSFLLDFDEVIADLCKSQFSNRKSAQNVHLANDSEAKRHLSCNKRPDSAQVPIKE